MRNALFLALGGILVVTLIVVGTTLLIPTAAQKPGISQESPPVSSQAEESVSTPQEQPYLLRTYEGKLAVFTTDYVTPDYVFEVYVKTLPQPDQEALTRGIRAPNYETLARLVEDYIS